MPEGCKKDLLRMFMNAKNIIVVLLLVCLPLSGVMADQDDFSGRVISLDEDLGTMTLVLFRAGHHGMHDMGENKKSGHGRHMDAAGGNTMDVVFDVNNLPEFVKKGEMIRIKGSFSPEKSGQFQAGEFFLFEGSKNDPTGVRQRLLKHH